MRPGRSGGTRALTVINVLADVSDECCVALVTYHHGGGEVDGCRPPIMADAHGLGNASVERRESNHPGGHPRGWCESTGRV